MDYVSSAEPDVDAFICTECGDGFRRYLDLVKHITVHERLRTHEQTDSFSLDSLPNGFQVPREYALHENGTFIVVDRSGPSNNPSSTLSPYQNSKTIVLKTKPAKTDLRVNTVSHSQCRSVSPLKQYRCETCGKLFNNQLSLQRHQQYRNLEQGYKCTLCCKIFTDKERLREHLQEHAHEIFYCCGQCGKRFLKQETLYAHQKEQHGSLGLKQMGKSDNGQENIIQKTYPCKKCNLCFFWLSDLQSHLLSHSKDKPLSVNSSSKIEQQSQKDELSHTIEPYRCGLCGDRFQQLTDLKEHHLTHQTQEEIDKLNKDSESQRVVKRRRRKGGRPPLYKKGSGTKLHPCKHCHRVFSHSSSLSRHNRSHKGTLHTCVLCGKHFPQRCDVRRHIAMYHKPELEKKPSLKYLALHSKPDGGSQLNSDVLEQNASSEGKPKKSLDGVVTELDSDNGDDQQTTSTGEVNYKCDQCGKKFGLLCVYQRHLRYHKREPGSEMVKCPRCPSRFRSSSALGRHLEIHPSQSSGETDMEGRASPTADSNPDLDSDQDNAKDLVGHGDIDDVKGGNGENIGPAEVLYECTECTETFSSLQKFLKHQSSHGSDNLG
ncbi:unnamed protein product [Oncorhynchus mykiss]|uniref:C2H2-type domain-containing protein n=1 Tax=Oncorhynchus mykiss TaxID=8022 RepID=A0A060X0F9_ONCMY|nr:unnamed protein product [Oncorhynchus mykiss]